MTYEQAFQIGSIIDGTIRRRYVEIFTKDGTKLFSIQYSKATEQVRLSKDETAFVRLDKADKNNASTYVMLRDPFNKGDREVMLDISLPVVSTGTRSTDKHVPAQLTDEGREVIIDACKNVTYYRWLLFKNYDWVIRIYKTYASGKSEMMDEYYDIPEWMTAKAKGKRTMRLVNDIRDRWCKFHNVSVTGGTLESGAYQYEAVQEAPEEAKAIVEYQRSVSPIEIPDKVGFNYHWTMDRRAVIKPNYVELIETLEKTKTVYVLPEALDWQPINIDNATIDTTDEDGKSITINLDNAIDAAEQRLKQAKTLLLASGLTVLI